MENSDLDGGFTLSAWVAPRSQGEVSSRIMDKTNSTGSGLGFHWYVDSNARMLMNVNNGGPIASPNGSLPLNGSWTHVAVSVAPGGTVTQYVNGSSVGGGVSGAPSGIVTANSFCIGNRGGSGSCVTDRTFDGRIDEAMAWGRVLTAGEVLAVYRSGLATVGTASDDGLVGYWPMNEGSGTVAGDASGNGNDGTFISAPLWSTGKLGSALDFDGSDDGLLLPMSVNPVTTGSMTVSMWARFDDDSRGVLFSSYLSADSVAVEKNTSNRLRWYWNDGQVDRNSGVNVVTQNRWQYLTFVRDKDANQFRMYVDGTLVDSVTGVGSDVTSGGPFRIGRDTRTGGTVTNGRLDEVRVYDRALSVGEILASYRSGMSEVMPSASSPYAWYGMNDGSGTSVGDGSGEGNDGTMSGLVSWARGRLGQAVLFAGGYVDTNIPSDSLPVPFSVSAWIYPTEVSANNQGAYRVFTRLFGASTRGSIGINQGLLCISTTAWVCHASVPVSVNQWRHVVGVWRADGWDFYVDGAPVASGANTMTGLDSSPALIGAHTPADRKFVGTIDEVGIYRRALTQAEVTASYRAGLWHVR